MTSWMAGLRPVPQTRFPGAGSQPWNVVARACLRHIVTDSISATFVACICTALPQTARLATMHRASKIKTESSPSTKPELAARTKIPRCSRSCPSKRRSLCPRNHLFRPAQVAHISLVTCCSLNLWHLGSPQGIHKR